MRGGRLNRERLAAIERWVAREGIECLYFLADPGDPETAPLAEESGFRLVDLRVTLDRRLGASGPESGAGRAETATGRNAATAEKAAAAGAVSSAGPPAAAAP
ncbi:MAG TPA: hypothetical protein VOA80_04195, partial [Thermoanaerobaculia bacterium]|nr:hypothetical protein [Thermoanaerobaculia bacterium]